MKTYSTILITVISMALICVASQSIQILSPSIQVPESNLSVYDAVEIGRKFLDDNGYTTGRVLSTSHEVREPNFYWNDVIGMVRPDSAEARPLWVIRYEQASRPGHYFEVWVAEGGAILGGSQCR
jgi:hypothetical protein